MAEKKWADMTKEERSARVKAGREAAKAKSERADIDALVEAKVAAALANLRTVQTSQADSDDIKAIAKKDPSTWTQDDKDRLRKEHDRLQAALEAIPFEDTTGSEPGTVVGSGAAVEWAPYTTDWYLDIEARRKDRIFRNGRPVECKHGDVPCTAAKRDPQIAGLCGMRWPDYGLYTVPYSGTKIDWVRIQGVAFALLPGVPTQLPTPHYAVFMDGLRGLRGHAEQFAPPTPQTNPGYMHVNISKTTGGPVAVLLGKGGLPSLAEREANDVPVTA